MKDTDQDSTTQSQGPSKVHSAKRGASNQSAGANSAFHMQRTVGNRVVADALGSEAIQRKPKDVAVGLKKIEFQVIWTEDDSEFYDRVLVAISRKSGIPQNALVQNVHGAAYRLHARLMKNLALRPGRPVRIRTQVFYDPSTVAQVEELEPVVTPAADTPAQKPVPQPSPSDDDQPKRGETTEQRLRRQAGTTARVLSSEVADADARGWSSINIKIEHNGEELLPGFEKLGPQTARPSGTTPVSADRILSEHLKPELDMILMGGKGIYQIQFGRNPQGRFTFLYFGRVEPTVRGRGMTEREELDSLGIPDRRKIYAKIFADTEEILKDYGIKIAGFTAEQVVLWIAGGVLLRGLGLLGSAAAKSFPTLIRALELGETFNIARALETLGTAEAEEFAVLMRKSESEALSAAEQTRLSELASKLESALGTIEKLPRPPIPSGVSVAEFGNKVMRWGTGNDAARARIATLTRQELESAGVTREMAEAWREFYRTEALRVPTNPSALGRADLMQQAVELLSGGK